MKCIYVLIAAISVFGSVAGATIPSKNDEKEVTQTLIRELVVRDCMINVMATGETIAKARTECAPELVAQVAPKIILTGPYTGTNVNDCLHAHAIHGYDYL